MIRRVGAGDIGDLDGRKGGKLEEGLIRRINRYPPGKQYGKAQSTGERRQSG